jgi:hypothetical protein
MTPNVLTPARLKQLSALQGTRGVIGSLVSKACLLTNGAYYVDVIGENPSLTEAVSKSGELTYGDDDGNFSLTKLHNAVKSTIDRKRKDALANAAENGAASTFPNVEAIRDDDASTVYIVNWSLAPADSGDDA